jgi:hypothetical protein
MVLLRYRNLSPVSDFEDIQNINFSLDVNDETRQSGNSSMMLYRINYLISFVSKYFMLKKGDLIFTGTPKGVSSVKSGISLRRRLKARRCWNYSLGKPYASFTGSVIPTGPAHSYTSFMRYYFRALVRSALFVLGLMVLDKKLCPKTILYQRLLSISDPTGFANSLAGGLGDLRSNHFHAGLDIRTEQREGLPVYAAAEGYVYKVAVQRSGYGNVIYLRHPNGQTTVYGHLLKFSDPLASLCPRGAVQKADI